jgi:polysaccharide biosynthesis protein PslG
MMRFRLTTTLVLLLAMLMVGCAPQASIALYVTPTPPPDDAQPATEKLHPSQPVMVSFDAAAQPATLLPTNTQPANPVTPTATYTWRGPVVGGAYTQPPTWTPAPTQAPPTTGPGTPSVTPTPSPVGQTAPAMTGTPLPNLDGARMGIQVDANLSDTDWGEAMRRVTENLGVGWVKVQVPWRDMQPVQGSVDAAFFSRLEQHIEDANRRGLRVLVSVVKAPAWARSNQTEDGPPDNPQHLADFLTLMLNEINPGLERPVQGEFIDAIEIWNEPNLRREWQGTLPFSGAGYMRLFAPAYEAIRAYSPTIPVITAGLAPTGNSDGSVDDTEYLRQMYAAGLADYTDVAVGVHPFGWANSPDATCCGTRGWDDNPHFFFLETINAYRNVMVANNHGGNKMWVTEFGWATWDGFPNDPPAGSEWMRFTDKWGQANYTIRAFQFGQSTDYIEIMVLWNLNFAMLDGLIENRDERIGYSIVVPGDVPGVIDVNSENGTERPLYWMIFDAVRPDVQLDRYD